MCIDTTDTDPVRQLVGSWSLPNGTLEIKPDNEYIFQGGNSEVPNSYHGDIKWENAKRFHIFTYGWSIECDVVFERTSSEYVAQVVGSGPITCQKMFNGSMRKIDSGYSLPAVRKTAHPANAAGATQ